LGWRRRRRQRSHQQVFLDMATPPKAEQSPHEMMKKFPVSPHHEIREIFADQIGIAAFDGSTMHLEFLVGRLEETKTAAEPKGERHVVCRLVMTPGAVVDLLNQLNVFAAKMVQAGLIRQNAPNTSTQNSNPN
jgi:hypothetical protein